MVGKCALQTPEQYVVTLPQGHERPEEVNEKPSLRPAHVTIPADHVAGYKYSTFRQVLVDGTENSLQVDDVMQAVICHDGVKPRIEIPCIQVTSAQFESLG